MVMGRPRVANKWTKFNVPMRLSMIAALKAATPEGEFPGAFARRLIEAGLGPPSAVEALAAKVADKTPRRSKSKA